MANIPIGILGRSVRDAMIISFLEENTVKFAGDKETAGWVTCRKKAHSSIYPKVHRSKEAGHDFRQHGSKPQCTVFHEEAALQGQQAGCEHSQPAQRCGAAGAEVLLVAQRWEAAEAEAPVHTWRDAL